MKCNYISDRFLLETPAAKRLYHEYAEELPIIDYHCHLPPAQIAADQRWENLTQIWLCGDHYKWRAMRWNGVPERYCSGTATDWEKFEKWAGTMPYLLRNPLYDWTHLELARYFGVKDKLLGPDTARAIWDIGRKTLEKPGFSCRGLMKRSRVAVVCTTDDPVDSLESHMKLAADRSFPVKVLPTWRPDRGMAVDQPSAFRDWVDKLEASADIDIKDWNSFMRALHKRHDFFHGQGCRLSDHGVEMIWAESYTERDIARIFGGARAGKKVSPDDAARFKSAMLYEFGVMDHGRNWTQQYHIGPMRNNFRLQFEKIGPDAGYDSISDASYARPLARLLDRLASSGKLARTILYNMNPRDNAMLATMAGNFQDGSVPGKIQFGSAWWFLDQKDGITRQIEDLSQMGVLSRFVGMLTDSRSFLSYARHEYFRRILCNILGADIENGRIPRDFPLVGRMVSDICYGNASRYFGFILPSKGRS